MKTKKWIATLTSVLLLVSIAGCAAAGEPEHQALAPAGQQSLTAEQARDKALEHAKVSADDVTALTNRYDLDDGVPEYEVEFRQGDYEFDYTIHAETGEVLEWDKEYDPVKAAETTAPTKPTESAPQTETVAPTKPTEAPAKPTETPAKPTEPAPEKLTKAEAEAVALAHAGLTANQVMGLETEYDVDDGVPEYSVEFYADGWEYDYEIHAETGKILEWDKDRDD